MKLEGNRVIVTGAASGIGKAIAVRFAREGARVVVSDLDPKNGEATSESIRKAGGESQFVPCDVSKSDQVTRLVEKGVEWLGGLDTLVNNAGIEIIKPTVELTEEEWDRLMSINVKGVFLCTKAALPHLEKSGAAAVVNVASAAGLIGWPLLSLYCASKGAVVQFTKALAQEYKGKPIRFNSLCPMVIETEMGSRFVDRFEKDFGVPVSQALEMRQGRLGKADEVAAAAVFLASGDASFVNGHPLPIDGGGIAG